MIFDIKTQDWAVHANKLNFVMNCCTGSIITIRGFHYFFYQLFSKDPFIEGPIISRILANGTVVDLKVAKPPFEDHFNGDGGSFKVAPFYQRFYKGTF